MVMPCSVNANGAYRNPILAEELEIANCDLQFFTDGIYFIFVPPSVNPVHICQAAFEKDRQPRSAAATDVDDALRLLQALEDHWNDDTG